MTSEGSTYLGKFSKNVETSETLGSLAVVEPYDEKFGCKHYVGTVHLISNL